MRKESRAFSGFSVDDIERAERFYGQTLGLNVTEQNGRLGLHRAGGTTRSSGRRGNREPPDDVYLPAGVARKAW